MNFLEMKYFFNFNFDQLIFDNEKNLHAQKKA